MSFDLNYTTHVPNNTKTVIITQIMKRLVIIYFLLNCSLLQAQQKPLKNISIADIYLSQTGSEKSYNIGCTREIYDAYFYSGRYRIEHQVGIKDYDLGYDSWSTLMRLDSEDAMAIESYTYMDDEIGGLFRGKTELKILVGDSLYSLKTWYYSPESRYLMLDININIAKHISISGFQAIAVNSTGIIFFTDIEQELWRRSAIDVLKH